MVFPAANVTVIIGAIEYPVDSDPSGCVSTLNVAKVIPHPQWNPENLDNDIGTVSDVCRPDFTVRFVGRSARIQNYWKTIILLS